MNELPEAIVLWLEEKRRRDRTTAAVLAVLALAGGTAVFLLMSFLVYTVLSTASGALFGSVSWLWPVALGLTAWFFAHGMKRSPEGPELGMDPMGFWVIKDICSVGPRMTMAGLRQVRCCGQLGELNVAVCAGALAYLAIQNGAVNWQDLAGHCPQLPPERLREQLSLLDGVLFLGEDAARVTLMEPFRVRLRWMLGKEQSTRNEQEQAQQRPEAPSSAGQVNEPERLSAYEILGLSPLASVMEIKTAYRKRMKECHPDLFTGMDEQAKALAERWTKALNAAYATLNPRHPGVTPNATRQR